jgi:hypothetical protein
LGSSSPRQKRLIDELLLLQLAILANRHDWQSARAGAHNHRRFSDRFVGSVFP